MLLFSRDAASPRDSITARCLIRQIQTNPSLMFSAAHESKILLLIACKTTKTPAPAKMPAGDWGIITGQQELGWAGGWGHEPAARRVAAAGRGVLGAQCGESQPHLRGLPPQPITGKESGRHEWDTGSAHRWQLTAF